MGIGKPVDRLEDDPAQEHQVAQRIHECGERLGPFVAERQPRVRRAARNPLGAPGEPECHRIGEHVQPVGGKRERPAHQPHRDFDQAESRYDEAGPGQPARRQGNTAVPGMPVVMTMRVRVGRRLNGAMGIGVGHIIGIMH